MDLDTLVGEHPIGPGPVAERARGLDEARFVGEIAGVAQGKSR